ncbi:LysR family transcriptional regulator [Actomonas aquatica]|uniref:LysR substrate-binding domain-containing protein n=1 Tax=Actomonas aquatica TaxID=2866162 RepID=A0ABZ1CGW8_9BACT|nr:LysR substrate-binding domain-containing protein [Opitutus sp. WL0086]WRQ89829.1 LysR substrate-binding domain-containing protein [Opitutus sp. WL0086]
MEIGQLRLFLAVGTEGNFTRAAQVCHLSQPALSYQIARLEEELGAVLFRRKPRAVELTDAGRKLWESAVRIVAEQEQVLAAFRQRDALETGELRLGVIPTAAPYLLPTLLAGFRAEHPGVRLMMREARTSELVREVVAEELEFAIVSDVDAATLKRYSLRLTPLFHERLLLAVPKGHALAGRQRVKVDVVAKEALVMLSEGNCLRDQTLQVCGQVEAEGALVCEQLPTQLAMVAAGLGAAIVPEMAVRESVPAGVVLVRITDPAPTRVMGILKRRGRKLSRAASTFIAPLGVG